MTRTATIKVAVSHDERAAIQEHALHRGLSVAALLRSAVLDEVRAGRRASARATADGPSGAVTPIAAK